MTKLTAEILMAPPPETMEAQIVTADRWLSQMLAYHFKLRHTHPGAVYQCRIAATNLRRLRTTGPWWSA